MQEPLYLEVKTMVSGRFPLNMSQLKFKFSHFWARFFPKIFWLKSTWTIHRFLLVNSPNTPIFLHLPGPVHQGMGSSKQRAVADGHGSRGTSELGLLDAMVGSWWDSASGAFTAKRIWGKKMNRAGLQVKLAGTTGISWSFHSLLWNKLTTCRWFSDSYVRNI